MTSLDVRKVWGGAAAVGVGVALAVLPATFAHAQASAQAVTAVSAQAHQLSAATTVGGDRATLALASRRVPAQPPTPGPGGNNSTSVEVKTGVGGRSQAVNIIVLMTVLSVAPAMLMLTTSFTKIAVVLSLTRNALGTPTIPPNQVLAGLALFLSLFVMSPVLSQVNSQALQPYLQGKISESQAFDAGSKPLRTFMLKQTGPTELQTMIKLSKEKQPAKPDDVSLTTLLPAFVLSELKAAFIIGFVIFIPFLVIDLVVSSILMSMGMMMLPPVMIALPFKLLLFVMVDGWGLIATTLIRSYA